MKKNYFYSKDINSLNFNIPNAGTYMNLPDAATTEKMPERNTAKTEYILEEILFFSVIKEESTESITTHNS